jgi:hypothetical protein
MVPTVPAPKPRKVPAWLVKRLSYLLKHKARLNKAEREFLADGDRWACNPTDEQKKLVVKIVRRVETRLWNLKQPDFYRARRTPLRTTAPKRKHADETGEAKDRPLMRAAAAASERSGGRRTPRRSVTAGTRAVR